MKSIIKKFLKLEKKDQLIFFLIFGTISNFLIAIIKFTFSLVIPSFWFFVNAIFSFVLGMCRFSTIKRYKKIKRLKDERERIIEEYKNYSQNGVMLIVLRYSILFC